MSQEWNSNEAKKIIEHKPNSPIVVESERELELENLPELEEGKIYHSTTYPFAFRREEQPYNRYTLQKTIGGLKYIFRLSEGYGNSYSFLFKTREYAYARIRLSPEDQTILRNAISSFIEAAASLKSIKAIGISPADTAYYGSDVGRCIEEILANPNNKLTRDEIKSGHLPHEVFELYYSLFDKDFLPDKLRRKGKAKERSEYFKIMFEKYMPGWVIENIPGMFSDLVLKRID
ncbi:MAG: hypothetical protein UW46_C0006G0003 [Candidatus Yanofskybacteria bacterium GW2011_GWF1_44_227]|uniref:Uncharacterized protein n=1 Tax=Candidatus Yanofskybacteria bacterium GW2011_GWE2_40_11 TaxID=1619033 RepID=A0A0G0TT06_9BACT|nr:MAG: hypothetical protein UT75_C0002G0054 [Candidatus Yanofskybacteria bacterium GW2011_GWE2_40_11]KKT15482.1 MAG: hypothetical protein UV97_C0006G0049 [Candidatus Yanofskybacteria bacterium GW2011_GWF2_43_596]KKT53102.1 MAG: hypothetical protein UW46_C0006G0003 [Candidatus Yanofskybacteria bacterium GW2011_GWF1_44_227]OGN35545.1 MAG: hypothetical protein A2207_02275 [Candidatus Yanofskybacteria bacterium RIFOXYA1_FULL_44_17]OGN36750.1 MAG: hypothetical protein A2241_03105 [Candidatus Yanofs